MRQATGGNGVRYATGFRSDAEAKAHRDSVVAGIELRDMIATLAAEGRAAVASRERVGATAAGDLRSINATLAAMGGTDRPAARRRARGHESFDDMCDRLEAEGYY